LAFCAFDAVVSKNTWSTFKHMTFMNESCIIDAFAVREAFLGPVHLLLQCFYKIYKNEGIFQLYCCCLIIRKH